MKWRWGACAAVVLLVLAVVPASSLASRAPRLRLIARDVQAFASDWRRYLAFERRSVIRVLDTSSGRYYTSRVPRGCALNLGTFAGNLAFPVVLVHCGSSEDSWALVDVRNGELRSLPPQVWLSVGRYWLQGDSYVHCPGVPMAGAWCQPYLDWHTGVTRYLGAGASADLDSPGLNLRGACGPWQSQTLQDTEQTYDSPYLLARFAGPSALSSELLLGRCGSPDVTTLASSPNRGGELSGGVVTWSQATNAYAYLIRRRLTYHWPVPRAVRTFETPVTTLHTHYAVAVAATTRQQCEKTCTIADADIYLASLTTPRR